MHRFSALRLLAAAMLLHPAATVVAQEVEAAAAAAPAEPELLTIGSAAPDLDIEHWVQDGKGAYEKVTKFTTGEVYVVEFWATWCPPCIATMPHLAELQEKYAEQGVQIISVSDEPLETVTQFLEREVQGKTNEDGDALTFEELTSVYCLTTDPDNSTNRDYMRAAKQNGIPTAFIVGKDGRIEWIGHPGRIDDPLEQVVTDTWDREAAAAAFKAEQEFNAATQQLMQLLRQGKADEAKAALEKMIADAPTEELAARAKQMGVSVEFTIYQQLLENDQTAAIAKMAELIELTENDPRAVTAIVGLVAEQRTVEPALLKAAMDTLLPLVEGGDANPSLLSAYARLVYKQGDVDKAIELGEKAAAEGRGRTKMIISRFVEKWKADKEAAAAEEASEEASDESAAEEAAEE